MRDEAQSLYQIIANALADILPPGWIRAQVEARMVDGRLKLSTAVVSGHDDEGAAGPHPIASNAGFLEFMQLRELMAEGVDGAWQQARLTLFADGAFDCVFGYGNAALHA